MGQAASTTRGGELAKLASGVETKSRGVGEATKQDKMADILASARGQAQTAQSGLRAAAIGGSYMLKGLENLRQEKLLAEATKNSSNPAPEPSVGRSFSPRSVLDGFFDRST